MTATACPVCGRRAFARVLRLEGVPVDEGRLATTAAAALAAPRGPVELGHCSACGMALDVAPRVEEIVYEPGYDTFLGHSPSFAAHVTATAAGLVRRHGLAGGTAVDVACGRGDFLRELVDHGMAAGVGIDPAAHEPPDRRITMIREHFAPELLPDDVALLSCRHMLYLLDDPVAFLRTVRDSLAGRGTPVYLELMNQEATLRACDPWDVTYEHRSYFTVESATRLLEVAGFEPLAVEPAFHERFLAVEARPRAGGGAPAVEPVVQRPGRRRPRPAGARRRTRGRVARRAGERPGVRGPRGGLVRRRPRDLLPGALRRRAGGRGRR